MNEIVRRIGFQDVSDDVCQGGMEAASLSIEMSCLERFRDVRQIKDDWRKLEQSSTGDLTYFQSYDWCATWWLNNAPIGDNQDFPKLKIYSVRREGELVMLWPLMIEEGVLGLTSLTFIGGALSQYGGVLLNQEKVSQEDICACWEHIKKQSGADLVAIDRVPEQSPLADVLIQERLHKVADVSSFVDLSDDGANSKMLNAAKASTRRNRKKRRKKLADGMELKLESFAGGTADYRKMVELMFRWKADWFRETGRPTHGLDGEGTKNFLAGLTDGAEILALMRGGEPIAAEVGFRQGNHFYSYLGAFDWSLERLSPGRVQIDEALQWLKGQDIKYYDLLGAPSTYKQDMADISPKITSFLHPASFAGLAYIVGWRMTSRPLLKGLFYRLSPKQRQFVTGLADKLSNFVGRSDPKNSKDSESKENCGGCASCSRKSCKSLVQEVH